MPTLMDLLDGLKVQSAVDVQAVHIGQARHSLLHLLLTELQRTKDHVHLVCLDVCLSFGDLEELQELLAVVGSSQLLPQHQVENQAEWQGEGQRYQHGQPGEGDGVGANIEPKA